jgi:putative phosphoesterase
MITLGVLADTHIPDRTRRLHPQVIPAFRQSGVNAILHAGDVSASSVLKELGQVAAVYAVRGNRDWLLPRLPLSREFSFNRVKIVLTHGHGSLWNYLHVHMENALAGKNDVDAFHTRLQAAFPHTRVIIYGHLHLPVNQWRGGQLMFNPGSPHFPAQEGPTIGLLFISEQGGVEGKIISLDR